MRIYTPQTGQYTEKLRRAQERTPQKAAYDILGAIDILVNGHIEYDRLSVTICQLFQQSNFPEISQLLPQVQDLAEQHRPPQPSCAEHDYAMAFRTSIRELLATISG